MPKTTEQLNRTFLVARGREIVAAGSLSESTQRRVRQIRDSEAVRGDAEIVRHLVAAEVQLANAKTMLADAASSMDMASDELRERFKLNEGDPC